MTPTPPNDEPTPDTRIKKPRRPEAWALLAGLLILLPLLGHLLNQQHASKREANSRVESARPPAPPGTNTETAPQRPTPRQSAGNNPATSKPSRAVYMVTHKHRLRDCHGSLTFSREGLRFESDEPDDSFVVGRDDVTVEGKTLRIRDKTWRFQFDDAVRAERIFRDWKSGTVRLVSRP